MSPRAHRAAVLWLGLIAGCLDAPPAISYFPGILDDVEIYQGGLADAEIAAAAGL